ncbi:MAG: MFS transporter [Deltaproteobacteria bacterium]|nr:MFS transporter [Deltaproteobacteria bacterium]
MKEKSSFNVLFVAVFLDMLGLGFIVPLLPGYATNLGATGLWIAVIFGGYSLTRVIALPIIGRISDKTGRKKAFIATGLFLYVLLSFGYVKASTLYELSIIRFIQGIASAMIIPLAMAYIGELSPKDREGSYMGTFSISIFWGMGSGPLLGGFLEDNFGTLSVFYAMGTLSAFSLILVLFLLPEQRVTGHLHIGEVISYQKLIKVKPVQGILIYRFVNAFIRGGIYSFLPIIAALRGLSAFEIGILISVNTLLVGIFQKPFGKFADKYDKVSLIFFGNLIACMSLLLIPVSSDFYALFLVGIIMGIGSSISMPAATAIAVRAGKRSGMGSVMGLFNMAMGIGMIVAPLISGVVMDAFNIDAVFYSMGAVGILGTFVFYMFLKNSKNL